jgi:hypothetical protein
MRFTSQRLASPGVSIKRCGSLVLLPDVEPCSLDSRTRGRDRAVARRRRNASSIAWVHQRTIAGHWPFVSRAVRLRGNGRLSLDGGFPLCGFESRQSETGCDRCRLALVKHASTSAAPRRWLGDCSSPARSRRSFREILRDTRGF